MNNHQKKVTDFVEKYNFRCSIDARLLDLTSEVGELANELIKSNDYGRKELLLTPGWEEELGDVYFSLIELANITGIDLGVALDKVLQKYAKRMEQKS
jgi:NTP pyrophosphatase (non-canonical NTP hydrolase)